MRPDGSVTISCYKVIGVSVGSVQFTERRSYISDQRGRKARMSAETLMCHIKRKVPTSNGTWPCKQKKRRNASWTEWEWADSGRERHHMVLRVYSVSQKTMTLGLKIVDPKLNFVDEI